MRIFTYRYMWKIKCCDSVNFKIVSDTEEGHKKFVDFLSELPGLERAGYEYLHEYDCPRIGVFETIIDIGGENDEKV